MTRRYFQALCDAMTICAEYGAVFVGQAVRFDGTAMRATFRHLPDDRLLEFPVAENCQMGFCTGIALAGGLPVCCFPRINFALEATSQIVQHLDKISLFSDYRPRVIIRTAVATDKPLDPGPQHLGDYSYALQQMFSTIQVARLRTPEEVLTEYTAALTRDGSTMLVEYMELYE